MKKEKFSRDGLLLVREKEESYIIESKVSNIYKLVKENEENYIPEGKTRVSKSSVESTNTVIKKEDKIIAILSSKESEKEITIDLPEKIEIRGPTKLEPHYPSTDISYSIHHEKNSLKIENLSQNQKYTLKMSLIFKEFDENDTLLLSGITSEDNYIDLSGLKTSFEVIHPENVSGKLKIEYGASYQSPARRVKKLDIDSEEKKTKVKAPLPKKLKVENIGRKDLGINYKFSFKPNVDYLTHSECRKIESKEDKIDLSDTKRTSSLYFDCPTWLCMDELRVSGTSGLIEKKRKVPEKIDNIMRDNVIVSIKHSGKNIGVNESSATRKELDRKNPESNRMNLGNLIENFDIELFVLDDSDEDFIVEVVGESRESYLLSYYLSENKSELNVKNMGLTVKILDVNREEVFWKKSFSKEEILYTRSIVADIE